MVRNQYKFIKLHSSSLFRLSFLEKSFIRLAIKSLNIFKQDYLNDE